MGWKISCCCSFKVASDIEYAHSLGIEVGGYDLIALTRVVQQQWMAVNNDEYPRLENSLYIMQVKKFLQENKVVDKRQMRLQQIYKVLNKKSATYSKWFFNFLKLVTHEFCKKVIKNGQMHQVIQKIFKNSKSSVK